MTKPPLASTSSLTSERERYAGYGEAVAGIWALKRTGEISAQQAEAEIDHVHDMLNAPDDGLEHDEFDEFDEF